MWPLTRSSFCMYGMFPWCQLPRYSKPGIISAGKVCIASSSYTIATCHCEFKMTYWCHILHCIMSLCPVSTQEARTYCFGSIICHTVGWSVSLYHVFTQKQRHELWSVHANFCSNNWYEALQMQRDRVTCHKYEIWHLKRYAVGEWPLRTFEVITVSAIR